MICWIAFSGRGTESCGREKGIPFRDGELESALSMSQQELRAVLVADEWEPALSDVEIVILIHAIGKPAHVGFQWREITEKPFGKWRWCRRWQNDLWRHDWLCRWDNARS